MSTQEDQGGSSKPSGALLFQRSRNLGDLSVRQPMSLFQWLRGAMRLSLTPATNMGGRSFGGVVMQARLSGVVYRPAPGLQLEVRQRVRDLLASNLRAEEIVRFFGGHVVDYGLLSTKLVTDVGVAFIVDAFQALATINNMKYHGFGTGTTAENQTDTALVTELTTEYVVNSTRPTGSQTEGATGNIYRTVGTLSPDSGGTLAITEHGIFSANAAGTLLDRSKFAAVNVVASADSFQVTYDLTLTAGG